MPVLKINSERFQQDFDALARIGATPHGGVNRTAFSHAHSEARAWFRERIRDAGLELHVDGAGNHSAILSMSRAVRTLLIGSHLDSVPDGGRFDGALGVLAALEVLRTVKAAHIPLNLNLEAIDFTDEESNLVDYLGSRALVGALDQDDLQSPMGGRERFEQALRTVGMNETEILSARRDPETLAGYLELHIEQGPVLELEKIAVGIVTGIVGIRTYQLTFLGKANHSGTTPMYTRLDAAQGASAFILAVREITMSQAKDCVANTGNIKISPGAFNVIPGWVDVSLEIRSIKEESLDKLEQTLLEHAKVVAERFSLGVEIKAFSPISPVQMNQEIQDVLKAAASQQGLSWREMPSGAGHDAQVMAQITPCGVIFVPSTAGISHTPLEHTSMDDCINGANVLLGAAVMLAQSRNL